MQQKQHMMSFWDEMATWIGANANNGTWYIGGVIAALGLILSIKLSLLVGVISYIFLAMIGYMGYQTKRATMNLTQVAFGKVGSFGPSMVNIILCMGWAAVNTFIAAESVSTLMHDLANWPVYGQKGGLKGIVLGIIIMSFLHLISISLGERTVRLVERIGIIAVFIFVIWESIVVLKHFSFHSLLIWRVQNKYKLSCGSAIDSLAAFNLAWVTVGADFTKFSKNKVSSTFAPFLGALLGVMWFIFVGVISTIGTSIFTGNFNPNSSDPSTVASKLGLGIIALIVIILTSTTANAVNLMAAGTAITNINKKIKLTPASWIAAFITIFMTLIPLWFNNFVDVFTMFLNYIGMILGPEIAIILTDYFIVHKANYSKDDFKNTFKFGSGAYLCWIIGVILYFVLKKVSFISDNIGVTFIVMIITMIMYLIIKTWSKRFNKINDY